MEDHKKNSAFAIVEFFGAYCTGIGISCEQNIVGEGEGRLNSRKGGKECTRSESCGLNDIGRGSPRQGLFERFSGLSQMQG